MNLKDMVHALHAAGLTEGEAVGEFNFIRGNPNSGSGGTGVYEFAEVRYPNRLDNCESCHKPGTYDVDLVPNVRSTVYDALPGLSVVGPWPMTGPSFAEQMVRKLPITAACGTCHDSDGSIAHYATNTSTALGVESCDVCHGPGRTADAVAAHAERNQ
jgi:OmcA/MtrC family decaheme c-type cytochrome